MAWFEEIYEFMYIEKANLFLDDALVRFTVQEIDFLEQALEMRPGISILDIGCGLGRHCMELAQRGYEVTGLDISQKMIDLASAEIEKRGMTVDFVEGDMRNIAWREEFEAIIMMDVTFGIFDDTENRNIVRSICRALKPGGIAFFAMFNPYFWATHPHVRHWQDETCHIMRKYRFDPLEGRVEDTQVYRETLKGFHKELPTQTLRAYTPPEMIQMGMEAGFVSCALYGDKGDFLPVTNIPFAAETSLGMFVTMRK